MDGNDLELNQDDEMSASEQDTFEAAGRAAEHGAEGVPDPAGDEAGGTREARDRPATGPKAPGEAATPGGERDTRPVDGQPGASPDTETADEADERDHEPGQVDELRAERDRIRDRHLRLAADFDNYRKRTGDRLRQRWDRAQADLVSRLLEPLDDLLRVTALDPGNASVEAIVEGVDLVERKFFRVLEEAGVEVVDPVGEAFDPNTMEAMMRVPAGSDEDDDMVERVFQRGYTFRGQLVRPARVSVFKA